MAIQNGDRFFTRTKQPNGFILLEVLVAMSLIMGSWMATTHTYQKLTLFLKQQESKRSQLRREFDTYEIESIKNDATRVSSRNYPLRASAKPVAKGKRPLGSQASGV
jgi:type II secretory pathway pseudopilin PulG